MQIAYTFKVWLRNKKAYYLHSLICFVWNYHHQIIRIYVESCREISSEIVEGYYTMREIISRKY